MASALDKINASLKKKYGNEVVVDFSDEASMRVERLVTESPRINKLMGGGIPRGRIIEIYGPESSGKTSMACFIAGQFQKQGEIVAFVDAEHALDPVYAKTLGYDASKGVFSQPDSGEEGLNLAKDLCLPDVGCVIVDSVSALTPQKELDGEIGDANVGMQARMMSQAMRKLKGVAKENNTTIIFINQIRYKIGVMFGNPETTSGGNALKFFSSVRIDVRKEELILQEEKAGQEAIALGIITRCKTVKNKTAPPYQIARMKIIFGKGVQTDMEWIEAAVNAGFVQKGGAGWMTLEDGTKVQGMDNFMGYLVDHPEYKTKLIKSVKDYEAKTASKFIEEEEELPTDEEVVDALKDEDINV